MQNSSPPPKAWDTSIKLAPKDLLQIVGQLATVIGLYYALKQDIALVQSDVTQLKIERTEDNTQIRGTLETLTHELRAVREDQKELGGKFSMFMELQQKTKK